jgi:multidrug efflux system outer membrane protein
MQWAAVYQDEALQALLKEALTNNYDIRIAASRIMQAEASLGVTRANQFPTVGGVGSIQKVQSQPLFTGSPWIDTLGLQMNYIVDFWGQYRRATEAARAVLLSTQYAKNVVQITLLTGSDRLFYASPIRFQLKFSNKLWACRWAPQVRHYQLQGRRILALRCRSGPLLVQQAEAEVISLQPVNSADRTRSAFFSEEIPALSRVASSFSNNRIYPMSPWAFLPHCWSGAPMCASRKKRWSRPMQM